MTMPGRCADLPSGPGTMGQVLSDDRGPATRMSEAPPAVALLNAGGASPIVLVCEHASNFIPPEYAALGLPAAELQRHIAWDIGAAELARQLSARLDAPLFLAGDSRLLIDLQPAARASLQHSGDERGDRDPRQRGHGCGGAGAARGAWFTPSTSASPRRWMPRLRGGRRGCLGMHSFTPGYLGERRPWHAGILYRRGGALRHGAGAANWRRMPALVIGDNEPYRVELEYDYTVPVHGDARGRDAVLLEVRQDLLGDAAGCAAWAARIATALDAAMR